MKYLVRLLLFFVPTLTTAQCKDAVCTKEMQDCMEPEWKKSNAELSRVYPESLRSSTQSNPPCSRKRSALGASIATPSAKPTTKGSRVAPPLP